MYFLLSCAMSDIVRVPYLHWETVVDFRLICDKQICWQQSDNALYTMQPPCSCMLLEVHTCTHNSMS